MYPMFEDELARQTSIERQRSAAHERRARYAEHQRREDATAAAARFVTRDVAIREAEAADVLALLRLSELDSSEMPSGRVLVAEVDGGVRAALAVGSGKAIADPFAPTGHLEQLLRLRAAQLSGEGSSGRRRGVLGLLTMRPGRAA